MKGQIRTNKNLARLGELGALAANQAIKSRRPSMLTG
jgi:hypothetical protein